MNKTVRYNSKLGRIKCKTVDQAKGQITYKMLQMQRFEEQSMIRAPCHGSFQFLGCRRHIPTHAESLPHLQNATTSTDSPNQNPIRHRPKRPPSGLKTIFYDWMMGIPFNSGFPVLGKPSLTTQHNKTHSSKQELHGDRHSNKDQQTEPNNIDNAPFCNKTYQPGAPSLKDHPESCKVRSPA